MSEIVRLIALEVGFTESEVEEVLLDNDVSIDHLGLDEIDDVVNVLFNGVE